VSGSKPLSYALVLFALYVSLSLSLYVSLYVVPMECLDEVSFAIAQLLHIFTHFYLKSSLILRCQKIYFRHFSQCLQGFRDVGEFFCCFIFAAWHNCTRSQGTDNPSDGQQDSKRR
jgi:hypothetical protein